MVKTLLPALAVPLFAAFAALAALADGPADPQTPLPPELEDVFKNVDAQAEKVQDLKAEFRQTKKMKIRKRPDVVTGNLSVKKTPAGPRICWESWLLNEATGEKLNPQRTLVLADEKLLWSYVVEDNAAEKTDLGKGKFEISEMLTVGGSLSGMRKSFTVSLGAKPAEGKGWVLDFAPTSDRLKRFVKALQLEIDPEEWIVSRVRYVDTADNVTEILLSNFALNGGVDEKLYEIPKDAKITVVDFDK